MHVAPVDLRALRQGGIASRFAMLGEMAYVLAEIPASGLGRDLARAAVHAAALGLRHRRRADVRPRRPARDHPGRSRLPRAGRRPRAPVRDGRAAPGRRLRSRSSPTLDVSDARLAAQGFELIAPEPVATATVVPAVALDGPAPARSGPRSWPMSAYVMTRVRMGERSGYTAGWCDAPALGPGHRGPHGDRVGGRRRDPGRRATSSTARPVRPVIGSRPPIPATFIDLTPIARLRERRSTGGVASRHRIFAGGRSRAGSRSRPSAEPDRRLSRGTRRARPSPRIGQRVARTPSRVVLVGGLDRGRVLGDRRLAGLEPGQHDLDRRGDRDRQERADEAADRRRRSSRLSEDQQRRDADRVAHDERHEDAALDELEDDVDAGDDDGQLGRHGGRDEDRRDRPEQRPDDRDRLGQGRDQRRAAAPRAGRAGCRRCRSPRPSCPSGSAGRGPTARAASRSRSRRRARRRAGRPGGRPGGSAAAGRARRARRRRSSAASRRRPPPRPRRRRPRRPGPGSGGRGGGEDARDRVDERGDRRDEGGRSQGRRPRPRPDRRRRAGRR